MKLVHIPKLCTFRVYRSYGNGMVSRMTPSVVPWLPPFGRYLGESGMILQLA
jgi:hypothetical protein